MSNNMKEKYKQISYSLATYFLEKNTFQYIQSYRQIFKNRILERIIASTIAEKSDW